MTQHRIQARLLSLGGGILSAIVVLITATLLAVYVSPHGSFPLKLFGWLFLIGIMVYFVNSLSEELRFEDRAIIFHSLLRRRQVIDLNTMQEVRLIHEGLNLEHGIETLIFHSQEGEEHRFALGPLWQRHQLEAFLHKIEEDMGRRKLLTEVR